MSLIMFSVGAGIGAFVRRKQLFPTYYEEKDFKKEIMKNWKETLEYAKGESIRNKNEQTYEILDIIKKHYGADCIISIPKGLTLKGFMGVIESLECSLKCDIMANLSKDKNSIYARLIYNTDELTELEAIKFKWDTLMMYGTYVNNKNETFEIQKLESKPYGYDMTVKIPLGFKFSDIEAIKDDIENSFNALSKTEWRRFDGEIDIKIITTPLTNETKFTPVKTESPHHVYYGRTHYQEDIIVDIYQFPMALISGATGMGKTYGIQTCITNIMHNWNNTDHYFAELSDKPDFEPFRHCKQTKAYCTDVLQCKGMFNYLMNVKAERNKFFKEKGCRNIVQYNKKYPNEKINDIFVWFDEFAEFMPSNKKELYYEDKEEMYETINTLVKQGRSEGIFLNVAIQRPDTNDMLANMKSNFNVKICYAQNNAASSKVVCDTGDAVGLPQTEALVIWGNNKEQVKTLWLDDDMIQDYLENCIEEDHKLFQFDINGNIIKEENKIIPFPTNSNIQNKDLNKSAIETTNQEETQETEHQRKQRERKEKWLKRLGKE